ncbi:PREDICTED: glycerol-3-phosphate dehydrogenase 1-like protein [Gekko japonicus]|uniref:Glycerol-3-phosphate dehydrogenase 1-like protein n=1 Tax=Gekko japonicus TaxID=146911 RepID=A0ABM1LEV6_GEKJA|nr:PREDICTED: glycerol-3-phosphate dehydrogenase 1-like protein [Gekko japonicus]
MPPMKVCIIGSGNWGSAIAKIVGKNVQKSNRFDPVVKMWVFEELINGRKLTEIINQDHENVKYLPGHKLPPNVLVGCKNTDNGKIFKELMQTPNFRVTVVDDCDTVEICGALKNIVAVGAGFCDGLGCGDNTKAAVIRLGLMEMIAFAKIFCKGSVSINTFLESCGIADLITTCYGGRNRKVAEAFARGGKTIEELEKEMLNGQKLQGPQTSAEVYKIFKQKNIIKKFPLFVSIYQICYEGKSVKEFITCLQNHPEHM